MTTIRNSNRKFDARLLCVTLFAGAVGGSTLLAAGRPGGQDAGQGHGGHAQDVPATLVQRVRTAATRFADYKAAEAAGYAQFLGCISGPDHGAMGIHYVNLPLVDGILDASQPEVLIYEPVNGSLRLVGVEFVVPVDAWNASHPVLGTAPPPPPVLEGQSFLLVDSPNRYGLPPHYELHVWAWRDNPNGAFVDWNNNVSCEGK